MKTIKDMDRINRVIFTGLDKKKRLGIYRQIDRHTWHEDGEADGRDLFIFKEVKRDQWTIHLFDASRKVTLIFDFHANMICYSDPDTPRRNQYAIEKFSSKPTGWLVNWVDFSANGVERAGSYKQIGEKKWVETNAEEKVTFHFEELYRDDWSIYLTDRSRGIDIQLDMHREMVRYGIHNQERRDLYPIRRSSTKLTGWLVNRVDFRFINGHAAGSYRQTGPQTWVEDSVAAGPEIFEFHERARDDWSVYLWDEGRKMEMQLDLHRALCIISFGDVHRQPQYTIAYSDQLESLVTTDPRTATWIEYGDPGGHPKGILRRVGPGFWQEDRIPVSGGIRNLQEISRDKRSLYLFDNAQNQFVDIEFHKGKVAMTDRESGRRSRDSILNSHSLMTGWVTNYADLWVAGEKHGALRQTGWTSWVEDKVKDGPNFAHFEEVGRDDGSIRIYDPSRNVTLTINTRKRTVDYSDGARSFQLAESRQLTEITQYWRNPHKITSRSALTEDYTVDAVTKELTPHPVYRSSISFSHWTTQVDIWASEETTLEINGKKYTVDPVRSVRVQPSALSKIIVSVPAHDLRCATLYLRTNLMTKEEKHIVIPDVEAHKKVIELKDGDLYNARRRLGFNTQLNKDHIDHIQRALKNIARSVQHSYNETSHGHHHDRALHPANMEHAHFKLDFRNGGAHYQPLTKAEVLRHIEGARRIEIPAGQGLFDSIGKFFKDAAEVVIHTAEHVVHDVVDTVEHAAVDVVDTVDHVGEDLIHGDILDAGKDLVRGGEHLGADLTKGVKQVGGDVLKGAGRIIGVTLKLGEDLVQFVIKHTGVVGEALGWLFEKAGASLGKVVGFFLDKIGWGSVIHAHDVIQDMVNKQFDSMILETKRLKRQSDSYFHDMADKLGRSIDDVLDDLHVQHFGNQPATVKGQSGAIEKMEWLLSKFFEAETFSPAMAMGMGFGGGATSPMQEFADFAEKELDADGGKIRESFDHALEHVKRIFEHPSTDPKEILGAVMEVVRGVFLLGIDIVSKVIDLLLDFVIAALAGAKTAVNEPLNIPFVSDFYKGIAHGRDLTILSAFSLLIATPANLLSEAVFGRALFDGVGAGQTITDDPKSLDPKNRPYPPTAYTDSGVERLFNASIGYGVVHLLMSIIEPAVQVANYIEYKRIKKSTEGTEENRKLKADLQMSEAGAFLSGFLLLYGTMAQLCVRPLPIGATAHKSASMEDLFESPEALSWITWYYQFGGLGLGLLNFVMNMSDVAGKQNEIWKTPIKYAESLGRYGGDVVCAVTGVYGIVHAGLQFGIVGHDDRKIGVINSIFGDGKPSKEVDQEKLKAGRVAAGKLVTLFDGQKSDGHLDSKKFETWLNIHFDEKGKAFPGNTESATATENAKKVIEALELIATTDHNHTKNTDSDRESTDRKRIEWVRACYIYWIWAKKPGVGLNNGVKGTGNFFDTVPEIAQFLAIPEFVESSEGITLAIAVATDAIGHVVEGGTYLARTANHALY